MATYFFFTRYARTSCRWQSQRSKFCGFCARAIAKVSKKKTRPDFALFPENH
ncbi:hypothetical protein [Lonepinella sp. BR2357]|uniref:hypothetical protein n=1 Tax=Lonepinella sp. BR2357 TaxID=3434549 RepID=UPI003F6DF11D